MTVSDFIAKYLHSRGVDCVFEMIGSMSVRIIDAIYRHGGIKIVSMHHEQAAAFAACGWAQARRVPGVAIATCGPGASNLVTGIATAFFDSMPAVFITAQVNQNEMRSGRKCRQMGAQEMDIVSVAKPIAKWAVQLETAESIADILPRAFECAMGGRQGPVLIDIPMNLQKEELPDSLALGALAAKKDAASDGASGESAGKIESFCKSLNKALGGSKRPLFLLGGGIKQSATETCLQELVEKLKIPAVFSLCGKGALPSSSEYAAGLIGTNGNRWANNALHECDLLIVLGSRLDVRQTGADTKSFCEGKRIFQVDIDESEINNRVKVEQCLREDLRAVLPKLADSIKPFGDGGEWLKRINAFRAAWPDTKELDCGEKINPNALLEALGSAALNKAAGFAIDVGANQVWCAQSLALGGGQLYLTSGGMASMGYAIPAAIGACIARNGEPVVAIMGDGGAQCNIQELEVIFRLGLPVKMLILNNHTLGIVRQFQEEILGERYPGTVETYGAPDFAKVALAYGIESRKLGLPEETEDALNWLLDAKGPALVEAEILAEAAAYPKMRFGHQLNDMYPPIGDGTMQMPPPPIHTHIAERGE